MTQTQQALLRLHLTPGLGRVRLFKLYKFFGGFTEVLQAGPKQLSAAGLPDEIARKIPRGNDPLFSNCLRLLDRLQVQLISFWDPDYPAELRQIHDPPALIYLRGQLPQTDCFAVVGSRRATPAGQKVAYQLSGTLASHDICIVSGLARGIDSSAHRGALSVAGATIAVLGCGIDQVYPPENARLFQEILEANAIISEYPPGTRPLAGHFPGRNRIISGLSRGVLIVEAAEGSGSLITGDFALEQGRELFAIPGGVQSPNSKGTNRLLKEGAQLVTEAADILQLLWPQKLNRKAQQRAEQFSQQLQGSTQIIYQHLGFEPLQIDDIVRKCGLTPMEVSAILLDLELQGGVQVLPGNHYIRRQL